MRAKLTYANVVATLALIIAVAGGSTAVALSVGKNSVQSSAIRPGNVTARNLANVRVVEVQAPGTESRATCKKNEQLIGGGGGGGSGISASVPLGTSPSEPAFSRTWAVSSLPGSPGSTTTAFALCLSGKPTK